MNYDFQRDGAGRLVENDHNLMQLRHLLCDWDIIGGDGGEGTARDDGGTWHGACHLLAAGIIAEHADKGMAWFEIAWDKRSSSYLPVAVLRRGNSIEVHNVIGQAAEWAKATRTLAYVEGNSCGEISNKCATDPGNSDHVDRRQDYHRFPLDFTGEGGKVWEHWCTTRNIREDTAPGVQAIRAYLTLLCIGGTAFAAMVLRGRPFYGHPAQLAACLRAGLVTEGDASWSGAPEPIPADAQLLFHYSDPVLSHAACTRLPLSREVEPQYFMFQRGINLWQPAR